MSSVSQQPIAIEDQARKELSEVENCFKTNFSLQKELHPVQQQLYAQMHSEYAGGADVIEGFVLANSDATSAYRFPKGQVVVHPIDAEVKSCSINPGLHSHLVMMRVLNTPNGPEINDAFFRKNQDKINEALPQYSQNPARLYMRDEKMHDMYYWTPEMGSNGWVGILKKRHPSGRDDAVSYTHLTLPTTPYV